MKFITRQGLSAEAVKRKLDEWIQPVEKLWKTAVFALIDRIFEPENPPRANLSSPIFAIAYNESL
jgi:hypothetical protein